VNLAGVLHGEQEIIFHNPIPPEGTLTTEGKITHIYDKGKAKGALVKAESETLHSNGEKLFTCGFTLFCRLDGGFGGKDAPKVSFDFPDKPADAEIEDLPSVDQPLLYRLSGDTFALHADPEFARFAGFEKPIMHGLCTLGFACRALLKTLIPGKPEFAKRLACRFSKPLYPGVPIKTLIWKTRPGQVFWKTLNTQTGEEVITNGIFEYQETL
jgi:acyl dehydratase